MILDEALARRSQEHTRHVKHVTMCSMPHESPGWLGSDHPYHQVLGRYFHYFPLHEPARKPFTNEILRPRLVYATGVHAAGQVAGSCRGASVFTTALPRVRAERGRVHAPPIASRCAARRCWCSTTSCESRWSASSTVCSSLISGMSSTASVTSPHQSSEVRGYRASRPHSWLLLRGDYGVVAIAPRPGEPRSRVYFSIGQAF